MAIPEHPIARETLEELLPRVRPRLKQILFRYRVPAHDSEDLLQEALIATFRKWDTIDDPEAWLLITLRNRCVIYWRKRRASLTNAVDVAILELLSEPQAAPQERDELRWDLAHLLHELSPRCQRLLHLRYRLGYDPQEVAAAMGYHPSSVRKVSRRCLSALTRALLTRNTPKAN